MIRLLGAGIVCLSGITAGFQLIGGLRQAQRQTREVCRLLRLLSEQIRFRLLPLPEIFLLAGQRLTGPVAHACRAASQAYRCDMAAAPAELLQKALETERDLHLPAPVKEHLGELLQGLGSSDLEGQLEAIAYARTWMEQYCDELERELAARCRSCGAIWTCAGLCLGIILL